MAEYNDNDFGRLIHNIRKNKKIKVDALVKGLCSTKVLYGIEAGDMLPGYLLRSALIGRLGLAPEWFDNMLTFEEYEEWQLRNSLIDSLGKPGEQLLLEEYKKKYIKHNLNDIIYKKIDYENTFEISDRLKMQFYLTAKAMSTAAEGDGYKMAAAMTSDIFANNEFDIEKLYEYKLSVNELNLYIEALWHSNEKNKTIDNVMGIVGYMDKNYYDNKAKTKLYSKLVVYYCRLNESVTDITELCRMWNLCRNAVELLREDKKSYYIIELFDIQINIADRICALIKGRNQDAFISNMIHNKQKIKLWRDILSNEYKKRGIPEFMNNDVYIYREGTAYCINDIVRARRYLLGYSRKELSDGICSEKTIEKTEQHRSSLQYNNMKSIYSRLNLPRAYQYSSLITCNIADLEKEEEMWNLIVCDKLTKALAILNELKSSIPDYEYNQQILGRAEIMIMRSLGRISNDEALDKLIKLLELTVPMECIYRFVNNRSHGPMKNESVKKRIYFTQAEVFCLISIGGCYEIKGDYEKTDCYFKLLYEYFVNNKEYDGLYGAEVIFRMLAIQYSSMLGDCGKYTMSNEIADMSAKLQLQLYRPQKVWWHKYNNLWNDNLKKKDKEEYNNILMECATLCHIYDDKDVAYIFEKKLI